MSLSLYGVRISPPTAYLPRPHQPWPLTVPVGRDTTILVTDPWQHHSQPFFGTTTHLLSVPAFLPYILVQSTSITITSITYPLIPISETEVLHDLSEQLH